MSKVAFVTGAARGIGAATATELARRGATVALAGLEPDRLEALASKLGPRHSFFEVDVTDQSAIEKAMVETVARHGRIDVVVANAGVVNYGTIRSADPDAFARTIEVNLTGVYRTIAAAVPRLIETRGYILVLGSVASFVPLPGAGAYAASKAAIDQLVRTVRLELAGTSVGIGIAYPSWVETDMIKETERVLPSFTRMRNELPWPVRSTHSPECCARALADGIEKRARSIYFPRRIRLVSLFAPVVKSRTGEAVMATRTSSYMPQIDKDVEALAATTKPIDQGT